MKHLLYTLLLSLSINALGQMRVYTVAGSGAGELGDGKKATEANLELTEGIWIDGSCNLYISDMGHHRIRKVDGKSGIISTIAGTGIKGYSGDNGPAVDAKIYGTYGIYANPEGNVYLADGGNDVIRRIDAVSGQITTFAGGGINLGDGGPATNAQIDGPINVYGDNLGNIYIGQVSRIRKVAVGTGIITTIAGTGIAGLTGDGGPATSAQVKGVAGMIIDAGGNLYFADRGNSRVRKINASTGVITTVAGTSPGFSGDNGQATNAKLDGPISIFLDNAGDLIIGDNNNDKIRKVNFATGIITTVAGGSDSKFLDGALASNAKIHPEFIYVDLVGNLYHSTYGNKIYRITNFIPGLQAAGSNCMNKTAVEIKKPYNNSISIYPNPAKSVFTINKTAPENDLLTITTIEGKIILTQEISLEQVDISIESFPRGLYICNFQHSGQKIKLIK